MVRRLNESDKEAVLAFGYTNPSVNLFLIGDVENFGVEHKDMTLWGQFEGDKLVGVLLRYFKYYMAYYLHANFDPQPFADILNAVPKGEMLSFNAEGEAMKRFLPLIAHPTVEETYLCELNDIVDTKGVDLDGIRLATLSDVDAVYNLLATIEEFGPPVRDVIESTLKSKSGRIYLLSSKDGKVVSMAQTTAENSRSAMIIGVCTHADHRKQGLMRRVMTKLCADLRSEGKTLCLFYSNPDAGKIYHSLGFKTIGMWTMIKYELCMQDAACDVQAFLLHKKAPCIMQSA